jgi:hypothetical protein
MVEVEKPYAAIFLDKYCQDLLLFWWQEIHKFSLHENVKAHHITIKYDPSPADLLHIPIGETAKVQIIGIAQDEKAQAVVVEQTGRVFTPIANKYPHITIAVAPGIQAVYSNELIEKRWESIRSPKLILSGVIDVRTEDDSRSFSG